MRGGDYEVRYTEMAPDRFKNFWKDERLNSKTDLAHAGAAG
jgi:nitrogen regulatory protein PII-like uncharacterized protein